jgi:hypothetical protein
VKTTGRFQNESRRLISTGLVVIVVLRKEQHINKPFVNIARFNANKTINGISKYTGGLHTVIIYLHEPSGGF